MGECSKGVNGIDKITRIDTEPYSVHLAGELKTLILKIISTKKKRVVWIDLLNMQL